jgi:hypothetical protein
MSLKSWGVFLDSFKTKQEAEEFIMDCNMALMKMGLENRMEYVFKIYPTYDNVRGRNWLYGVYLQRENTSGNNGTKGDG